MRAKICTVAVNMTTYPSVRKPALDAPEPIELEFARDKLGQCSRIYAPQYGERRIVYVHRVCPYRRMLSDQVLCFIAGAIKSDCQALADQRLHAVFNDPDQAKGGHL
jgi:hypothetical protein